jgi:hypothetical protein
MQPIITGDAALAGRPPVLKPAWTHPWRGKRKVDPLFDNDGVVDASLFAENNARELALWGDDLSDMRLLRRRGFAVWAGPGGPHNGVVVNGKTITTREFRKLAARERRLTES